MSGDVATVKEVSPGYGLRAARSDLSSGYKQTEVGLIPQDWSVVTIGDLNPFVTSGSRGWARYYSKFGSIFIRITNMDRNKTRLDLSDVRYVRIPENEHEGTRTSVTAGDVLISITADIGIISYADDSIPLPAYINQHIALVRFDSESILPKYAALFLAVGNGQKRFKEITDQGAKAGINLRTVRDLPLAIPPSLDEQRAIATALSDVDALLEELDRLIAKKRDLKQATMQQLLTGQTRLPGFEGEWRDRHIGPEIDLLTGFPFPSADYFDSGIKLLRGSNIKRGMTDWSDDLVQYWPRVTPDITHYVLKEGDIVIAMDGSLVGRSFARLSHADLPALLLQRVARVRSQKIDMGYLKEWICSDFFTKHCDAHKTVTAIPHISPGDIRSFVIQIPPTLEEQAAIATVLSDMDTEIQALEQRRAKTAALKQAMMQELLTGRIRLT